MNDDELIARLRRTLAERAEHLDPSPGRLPAGPAAVQDDIRFQTAPLPVIADRRRRWAAGGALVAVGAAAAAVIGTVAFQGGHPHPTAVGPASPATSATVAPPVTGLTVPTSASPTTVGPPVTVAPQPVPAGFAAVSVTFVSANRGWALGFVPCGADSCAAVASTRDGGRTWSAGQAPPIAVPVTSDQSTSGYSIRFADGFNGWVYGLSQLWSTHDGGQTWSAVAVPGPVRDLEAAAGTATLVTLVNNTEEIWTTPATRDAWVVAGTFLPQGAGPVISTPIVLFGPNGWILDNDGHNGGTVIAGGRLAPGSGWVPWTPPCLDTNGYALLAAASPTDLAAVCAGGPSNGATLAKQWYLVRSTDGGTSFVDAGPVAPGGGQTFEGGDSLTVPPGLPSTVVVAGTSGLTATFDGGGTWSTVYPGSATYVGFTTAKQAVAIVGTSIVMSRDGGHTWAPVRL